MGTNAPMAMMNIFGSSPMPSHRMERDTHEMGGMGLIRLKMGLKNALKYLLMPMKNPSGMPRAQAMPRVIPQPFPGEPPGHEVPDFLQHFMGIA